jgi:uncharacterized protein YegP (UPF0339 family)
MTFLIRPTDFGHYQFSLSLNGNILLSSLQTFSTLKHCKDTIVLLKDSLNKANSLCSTYSSIGGHYFYVCDEQRDPIAMSDIFSSQAAMKRGMKLVMKAAKSASIEDQMFHEFYIKERKSAFPELVA